MTKNNTFVMTDSYESPLHINYDIRGMFKDYTISFGELQRVDYYLNCAVTETGKTFSNLAVTEYRDYTRQPVTDLVAYRTLTVDWYLQDGTVGETKVAIKYYPFQDAIAEGKTRRSNIIALAEEYVLMTVGLQHGIAYLTELIIPITAYVAGTKQPLIDAVGASTDSFITPELKTQLISILNFSV